MKQKVSALPEENIVRRAKRRAVDECRPLNDIIQDALERYLSNGIAVPDRRYAAYQSFCERPMRLAPAQIKVVLDHDCWNL